MKMDSWMMWIVAAVWFVTGIGWGQWWAERQVRKEIAEAAKGRMQVTLPVNPEDAAATLELLSLMMKKAEMDRKALE